MHWVTGIIGLGLFLAILSLVRRDRLHGPYALWWLLIAVIALILGVFPTIVDWVGQVAGVHYPPILPILVALALVMVRLLQMDIHRSHQERRLRRLVQKLALLESELDDLRHDNTHPAEPSRSRENDSKSD